MVSAKWWPYCLAPNQLTKVNSDLRSLECNYFCDSNPLRAKFFRGNISIYLHFMSLLPIDMAHVLKILPQVKPGPTYST